MTHHHARKRATPPPYWTERLRNALPTREILTAHPWLKPIASRVLEPKLWRLQHEAVARGVAIGTFWAFAIPVGQVFVSTAHCVWWRGHIPVAAGVTLLTNPLTIGFWLWLAFKLGCLLLGGSAGALPNLQASGVLAWLSAYGAPTLLGMALFATVGAAVGYGAVKLGWRLRIWFKRRNRGVRAQALE